MTHQDKPLKNKTKIPLAKTNAEVPKSGCLAIIRNGINVKMRVPKIRNNEGGIGYLDKYHAAIIGIASFINSLGCTLPKPGMLIHL